MSRRKKAAEETGDARRRRLERERAKGDDAAAERLAAADARDGRPPLVRLRVEDYAAIRALDDPRELGELLHDTVQAGIRCRREEHAARVAGQRRTAREALALATLALATASGERARAVGVVLRLGAGHLPLPEGATYSSPAGLVPELREAWVAVADAIRLDTVGLDDPWRDDATWTPIRAGEWESVLATLLVEREWDEIERTARDLEHPRDES